MASNMPLRGRKADTWEGGVRGVALAYGAGLAKTGYVNHQLMHVTDLYHSLPSLAARCQRSLSAPGAGPPLKGGALPLKAGALARLMAAQPPFLAGDGLDVWDSIASNASSPRTEIVSTASVTPPDSVAARSHSLEHSRPRDPSPSAVQPLHHFEQTAH
jgi:hypothetical protein